MTEKTRCEECNRSFPSLDALSMHNAAKHSSTIIEKNGLSKKINYNTCGYSDSFD